MPRLESFTVKLRTGKRGLGKLPAYQINGFTLEFDRAEGGTDAHETLVATGEPQSFPHSLILEGPTEQPWDLEDIDITYHCFHEEPYTVRLGPITLDESQDLNIWHERPAHVIDV